MLMLLSPAKKLDYDSPVRTTLHTQPLFVDEAHELIRLLKGKSVPEVATLMKLSDNLATLNAQRYQDWSPSFDLHNSRPAILAFNGDVYDGLEATSLSDDQLQWAQDHLAILSGLYGVLRPLDLMQPYRLEMGTRLENPRGRNLYAYWGSQIAGYLDKQLAQAAGNRSNEPGIVLNLASAEYFKAVDRKALQARVVECVFQDYKSGDWKVIGFHAKRARGLMARFVIDNRCTQPDELKTFAVAGYAHAPDASTDDRLVFRRDET
ncbi:MAG TPA: peroxide stress protein YaaA [Burkholderiaceae bacterium]|nr:peroxide stress protein YaaA [Burkholderiaceae bacterium]